MVSFFSIVGLKKELDSNKGECIGCTTNCMCSFDMQLPKEITIISQFFDFDLKVTILTFFLSYTLGMETVKKGQNSEIISHHNEQKSQDIMSELFN